MDGNEIVCWRYGHKRNRAMKGSNSPTAFYVAENERESLRAPIGRRVIAKSEENIRMRRAERQKEKARLQRTK
jgi:hypothetical protein